jgi:membrane protease YdiL (CAAX protease family)
MNPFSLPALMGGTGVTRILAFEVAFGAAVVWAGSRYCARLVRDGLASSPNAFQGTRRTTATAPAKRHDFLPEGIVGKELRLLSRDRNLFVQIFIVPLLMAAMQLVLQDTGFVRTIVSNFQAASAFAYGLGAYVLIGSLQVLVVEGNSLWMLYAVPVSIHRILLRKTLLWACLGVLYTGLVLAVCGLMIGTVALKSLAFGAMACAGIFIYAFIGAGIGILGSNPLETEVHRRMKVSSVYLYMILAAMYGYALYAPALWTRLGQIVLSSLLAYALWQKVRDHEPFLLDPVSAPPPRVSLADGLIAALAFFVLQGVVSVIAIGQRMSKGSSVTLGFVLAGALVAAFYLLTHRRTPAFFGAQEASKTASLSAGIGFGVMGGLTAGGLGLLFILAVERVPFLQQLEGGEASPLRDVRGWWLWLLTLLAAPVFEEFIFRGLLFRGMRRSLPLGVSVFGSAAVFALCHPPVAVVPVFAMAVLAAWSFAHSGRLTSAMALHATYNAIVVIVPMLFFTTTPVLNKTQRDDASGRHSALGKETAARAGGSALMLTEPAKGRSELVHFAGYRGGMDFAEPSFDLWVPSKQMLEYSVIPNDRERFGWLAEQFHTQLQKGDVLSGNDLGILYLYGLGVQKNWAFARDCFVKPITKGRWVGQRFLAELILLSAKEPEDARLAAELVMPMIQAKNWLALRAALRAHDLLVASHVAEDRTLADRLTRLCVDRVQAGLENPPSEKAKRQAWLERMELITQSLLRNPDAEDLRLAEELLGTWIGVESGSVEARLYGLRLRIMKARKSGREHQDAPDIVKDPGEASS